MDLGKSFGERFCFGEADGAGGFADETGQRAGIIRIHYAKPGNLGSTVDAEDAHLPASLNPEAPPWLSRKQFQLAGRPRFGPSMRVPSQVNAARSVSGGIKGRFGRDLALEIRTCRLARFADPFVPTEAVGRVACNDLIEIGEMSLVFGEEFFEPILEAGRRRVGVETDGPESGLSARPAPRVAAESRGFRIE